MCSWSAMWWILMHKISKIQVNTHTWNVISSRSSSTMVRRMSGACEKSRECSWSLRSTREHAAIIFSTHIPFPELKYIQAFYRHCQNRKKNLNRTKLIKHFRKIHTSSTKLQTKSTSERKIIRTWHWSSRSHF